MAQYRMKVNYKNNGSHTYTINSSEEQIDNISKALAGGKQITISTSNPKGILLLANDGFDGIHFSEKDSK